MTAIVWANILLTLPFLIAFIAVPLWWTFKRPQTGADHTEARTYLRTRTAFAEALARRTARTPIGTGTPAHTPTRAAA
jgi:hypothetical protein